VNVVSLNIGWQIQSSCEVKAAGEQISAAGFSATGWHKTTVPNTVVGSLVDDKTYADPTYGTNLKKFAWMNYSSATFFALQDMPEGSPLNARGGGEKNFRCRVRRRGSIWRCISRIELSRERLGEREKDCGRERCRGDVPHF